MKVSFWYQNYEDASYMFRVWEHLRKEGHIDEYKTINHDAFTPLRSPSKYARRYLETFSGWRWVVRIPPYHSTVVPIELANELGKETLFFSPCPFWERDLIESHIPGLRPVWKRYLQSERTKVVTFTEAAQRSLLEIHGIDSRVIPSTGVPDTNVYRPLPSVDTRTTPTVLFVGRMVPEKGIDLLLNIAESTEDVEFWFCGSGPMADEVERQAKRLSNVRNLGYISDEARLIEIYNEATVLAHPVCELNDWVEYYGGVIVEALACGTPVVATAHPGPKSILTEDIGVLIPESATDQFESELLELAKDRERCDRIGQLGREHVRNHHSLDEVSKMWLDALQGISP